jgi:predicted Zn-dependent peptidase
MNADEFVSYCVFRQCRIPAVFPQPSKASVSSVSTLPNGLTVVTETSASTTTVTLTFPGAGSGSESLEEAGAALVNKSLAFKSGSGLSSALIIRNFDDDGAVPFSTADRMSATVGFTCAPDKALRLIPLIATSCTFEKWDVRDAIATAQMEVQDASENAQVSFRFHILSMACLTKSDVSWYFTTTRSP